MSPRLSKVRTCTCPDPKPIHPASPHKTNTCDLYKDKDWKNQRAEWVPQLQQLVFYDKPSGTKDEKKLVATDGTIIPLYDCYCTPKNTFTCPKCGVTRNRTDAPFRPLELEKKTAPTASKSTTQSVIDDWEAEYGFGQYGAAGMYSGSGSTYKSTYKQKDRHYGAKLTFPDGTTVWASSQHTRKKDEPVPDFGLYLATAWSSPECLAYRLSWADYGLPEIDFEMARWAIEQSFEAAKTINVEVGCVGGHGRTGTVLACMAVIAGVKAKDAVQWVRDNYCEHAVESPKQEWFVKWFDCTRRGVKPPKMPVTPASKPSTSTIGPHSTWTTKNAFAFNRGSRPCPGKDCKKSTTGQYDYCLPCEQELKKVGQFPPKKTCTEIGCTNTYYEQSRIMCTTCENKVLKKEGGEPTVEAGSEWVYCKAAACTVKIMKSTGELCTKHKALVAGEKREQDGKKADATSTPAEPTALTAPDDDKPTTGPHCPDCGVTMVTGNTARVFYCHTIALECVVSTSIWTKRRGWVFYNEDDEEIYNEQAMISQAQSAGMAGKAAETSTDISDEVDAVVLEIAGDYDYDTDEVEAFPLRTLEEALEELEIDAQGLRDEAEELIAAGDLEEGALRISDAQKNDECATQLETADSSTLWGCINSECPEVMKDDELALYAETGVLFLPSDFAF